MQKQRDTDWMLISRPSTISPTMLNSIFFADTSSDSSIPVTGSFFKFFQAVKGAVTKKFPRSSVS